MKEAGRRIAALDVIVRLRNHEMEEEARGLAELRGRVAGTERARSRLRAQLREEGHSATLEAAPYVAGFIRQLRGEIEKLDAELAELNRQADTLEEAVRGRFRELKSAEAVAAAARWDAARQERRREAAALEEQALLNWDRGRAPKV